MIEILSTIISAIISIIPSLNKGDSAKKEKTKKLLTTVMSVLLIFVMIYVFIDMFKPVGSKQDYSELKLKTDSVIRYNKELTVKYDSMIVLNNRLIAEMKILKERLNNYNLEKFPFKIDPILINETRASQKELLSDVRAAKISLDLFHNPMGFGNNPLTIRRGFNSYVFLSVLITVSEMYGQPIEETYFQNIPLNSFEPWFDTNKFKKDGYVEYHVSTSTYIDKILMKMIIIDPSNVNTFYLFGVKNYDNKKSYGDWIGCVLLEFGSGDRVLNKTEIQRVKIFCDGAANNLSVYRKVE